MGGTSNKRGAEQDDSPGMIDDKGADAVDAAACDDNDDADAITNDGSSHTEHPAMTITVFGMSTEGYEIARRTAVCGHTVYVVDESNPTAILLNAEIARTYPDISALQEDEPIMSFEPLQDAVSKSDYLFFAPRIRTQSHNTRASIQAQFKDAVEYVKSGASVISCVPVGPGDNGDFASILQYDTGLEIGSEASYYYYPIESGRPPPSVMGSATPGRYDERLADMLPPPAGDGIRLAALGAAEHLHMTDVILRFAGICSLAEVGMSASDEAVPELEEDVRMQEMFVDAMIGGLFDMRQFERSLERAKPLQKIVSTCIRTIESYAKRLADRTRQIVRYNDMRITRTKIVILWSFDRHLLRDDRGAVCGILFGHMHDLLDDVEVAADTTRGILAAEKNVVVIACTQRDFEMALEAKKEKRNLLVIRANPMCAISDDNDDNDDNDNDAEHVEDYDGGND